LSSPRRAPTILCTGIAVRDIVMQVERFPAPGTKISASEFVITGGGCAANAAVAISRLGGTARFAGPLGDRNDEVSQGIVEGLKREGVDASGAVHVAGATASVSLILLDTAGEKTIATRRGKGLSDALPADAQQLAADIDAVLADNRFPEFVTPICRAARARGVPEVIDLDRATTPDDPLLALGTHVIASAEALHGLYPGAPLEDALSDLGKTLTGFLAVTDGPAGTFWLDNGRVRHLPAFAVTAIDTLGAGDVFHGAFTLALIETGDAVEAMRFGAAAAAIKCTRFGGLTGAATRQEVETFLAQHASAR
jgi:sugar/nucleoside kinase (ribokinase family)